MAAFGQEAAKYLAENYLDESHAADFLSAMETVAKYGLNGSVSDGGKGRSFRHEKGQRLCRLEGKSGKDKAAGHIPECEIQRLPVISGKPAEPEQPFQFMDQRERKPLYEMAGGLM